MKLVSRPEGFDLRERRAKKQGDAKQWTPADALYDASERSAKMDVTQLAVYWWERLGDGTEELRWSHSTQSSAEHAYLLQKALNDLVK